MIGGGDGAFIGAVHRAALRLDGGVELVAGALSSTPERALASAEGLGLARSGRFGDWRELLAAQETAGPDQRIDFVAIVTPNHAHAACASAFARAGIHVVVDKPMVCTSAEARALAAAVAEGGGELMVTYNYTGYPMVQQAAAHVRCGAIGAVRKVVVEYHQGWLAGPLEGEGHKQASWRTDAALAGAGGAVGDIGTHAENLVSAVTGLEIREVCAELTSFVPGRTLDDDASVLLRLGAGARGTLSVSQVAIGEQNALTLRVYGDTGALAWAQEQPEALRVADADGMWRTVVRGGPGDTTGHLSRLPGGHPEGFIEALANLYGGFLDAVRTRKRGQVPSARPFPGMREGARGVAFVEAVVASSAAGGAWTAVGDAIGDGAGEQ